MRTPNHATDSQINRLWDLLQLDHTKRQLEALKEQHQDGLGDWMKYNEKEKKK